MLAPALATVPEKTVQNMLGVRIVGAGAVGKATGIGLRKLGHAVDFYDSNREVLDVLKREGLHVSESLDQNLSESDVVMICVPTPTVDGHQDLSHVLRAAEKLGEALRGSDRYMVVVVRSTVLPGSTRSRIIPVLERSSGKKIGEDFGVCSNPEFLRAASALKDFLNSPRIVVGESDSRAGDVLARLYKGLGTPIVKCSLEEAELVKYVCNAFLASKISFFNEIYKVCQKIGVDDKIVSYAASLDGRIGGYGVEGGRAFDGPCLPKDLDALIEFVKGLGESSLLLEAVRKINEDMRDGQ